MRKLILNLFIATIFLTPLVILPLTIDYYHPPKELFSQLFILLCLVLWLIKGIRQEKFEIVQTKFYLLLLLYAAVTGLSLIWAKSGYLGLRDYSQILTYITAFFICVNTVGQKEAKRVALFAFIAGFISALYAVFQYYGLEFIKYPTVTFPDWRFRLYSTFGNPDFLANYLSLIFPVGVVLYISTQKFFKKLLLLLALSIIYFALLVTFSIGALSGLFFGLLFMLYIFIAEKVRLRNILCRTSPIPYIGRSAILLFVILGLISLFLLTDNPLHSPSILDKARFSPAWSHGLENRLTLYKSAGKMIRDNPVLGVGIGNFKLRFPEYRGRIIGAQNKVFDSQLLDKERDRNVLNEFLQIWAETGVFGLIVFILILFSVFSKGIFIYSNLFDDKRKMFVLGLVGGISAFLVHSFVSFPLHVVPNGLLFWTFIGLLFTQLPRQDKISSILYIGPIQKKVYEVVILAMAIILSTWPIRMYLADVFLKRMVGLDKKGNIDEAVIEARTALFFDPDSNAIVYLGNYATLNRDYKTAAVSFTKALENNDEINFHIALAEIYHQDGLIRDCINEYSKALLLNPLSVQIRLRLAELYTESEMYPEAEAQCEFILINNLGDNDTKKKVTSIANKIFDKRFLSTYYGKVQVVE